MEHVLVVLPVLLPEFLDKRFALGRMREQEVKKGRWMTRVPPRSAFARGKQPEGGSWRVDGLSVAEARMAKVHVRPKRVSQWPFVEATAVEPSRLV